MIVQRAGYWEGQYPRVGDSILVDLAYVQPLELNGFAVRSDPPWPKSESPSTSSVASITPSTASRTPKAKATR
jgi:hypothetical protein